jgi:hypothetical protein
MEHITMTKTRSLFAALAVGTIIIAGCSAESTDYEKKAEETINKDDQWDGADCVKPESTKVGTTFACTATVTADQSTMQFIATIDKKNSLIVTPTLGDETGDTTESSIADDGTGTTVADDGATETTVAADSTETTAA